MKRIIRCLGLILFAVGLANAEPPEGKGKKEQQVEPIQVYAQGVSIGRYLGGVFTDGNMQRIGNPVWILSSMGYVFTIDFDRPLRYLAEVSRLYFSDTGCKGTASVGYSGLSWAGSSGVVFKAPTGWSTPIYYSARGELGVDRLTKSQYESGSGCQNVSGSGTLTYRIFPNDEAITGVPNIAPAGPFVLGPPE